MAAKLLSDAGFNGAEALAGRKESEAVSTLGGEDRSLSILAITPTRRPAGRSKPRHGKTCSAVRMKPTALAEARGRAGAPDQGIGSEHRDRLWNEETADSRGETTRNHESWKLFADSVIPTERDNAT